ncbi:MAG: hypothetical protein A2Z04_09515 [Chloroflexi bacterium RBG_16_57_9]|nr:MAG: hypothetical protein A2Z04_09515 [Chloroflexi bacterium RBG_16_57_9]
MPESNEIPVPLSDSHHVMADHAMTTLKTAAHVLSVMEVDLSRVLDHQAVHVGEFRRAGLDPVSATPYLVRAVATALPAHRIANSTLLKDQLIYHGPIHVGVALHSDSAQVVPVIRDADRLDLFEIARHLAELTIRLRLGQLTAADFEGGTVTVVDLGPFGDLFGMPLLIQQPQAAVVGLGRVQKRAVIVDDAIHIRPMAYLCINIDHRMMDGYTADQFLGAVKQNLENV